MKKKEYLPRVSIVIPAYNASNYLAEAIESAISQTYDNIEIIVVNDGSKDNGATADVAKKYENQITYFEKNNGGSSSALNCGIAHMTGEWFSWLSHDDLYYPEKIKRQIEYMNKLEIPEEQLKKHVFFTASELINEKGKVIQGVSVNEMKEKANKIEKMSGNQYLVAEPTVYTFHGCGCLIHKSVFKEIGTFDEKLRLVNDMDMWYRIFINDFKVHFIPEVLVKGRVHSKQVSKNMGYSYHNPEQDMFWTRSLKWLQKNYSDEYELFVLFGHNAYLKTRGEDGKNAFNIAMSLKPEQTISIRVMQLKCRIEGFILDFFKKIYRKIYTR